MAYGDIDAGMTEAEKQHLAELEATCEKQSRHISEQGAEIERLKEELGIAHLGLALKPPFCKECGTFSWKPCALGDDGAVTMHGNPEIAHKKPPPIVKCGYCEQDKRIADLEDGLGKRRNAAEGIEWNAGKLEEDAG